MSQEPAPAPMISLMRESIKAANAVAPPELPIASDAAPICLPGSPEATPMTVDAMFARFRADMRRAGLVPYEIEDTYWGAPYKGPAVNVRDPRFATEATRLTCATHGVRANVWRVYPVLEPIKV